MNTWIIIENHTRSKQQYYVHASRCTEKHTVSPAPQFMGTCTASLMSHFVTCLLISVVYIIALCSSINTTTFFSLYVRCCPVLDLTHTI
jgi:hypothetical protein